MFKKYFIPSVKVETPSGVIQNLDGEGLRVTWQIERDNTNKVDHGAITIFNVSPLVSGAWYALWEQASKGVGMLLTLSIGWGGSTEMVFVGDVWDMIPDRRTPTDVLTIFKLGDGDRTLRNGIITRDFHNVQIAVVLEYLVSLPPATTDIAGGGLGLVYPPESRALVKQAASEIKLHNFGNIPAGSSMYDSIDIIMDTLGLNWRVHNRKFIAMRGGISKKPGPILRSSTGLLSRERMADGGVQITSLANPAMEPGLQFQVQDNNSRPFGSGIFRSEKVVFEGDTVGESLMHVTGRKAILI